MMVQDLHKRIKRLRILCKEREQKVRQIPHKTAQGFSTAGQKPP